MADRAAGGGRGAQRVAARGDRGAGAAAAGGDRGAGGGAAVRAAAAEAAAGVRRVLGAGADGGQRGGAPHPHLPPEDRALENDNKKIWLLGNKNKDVEELKTVFTGSPFKSENTPTKLKNKRRQDIFDELRQLKTLIGGLTKLDECKDIFDQYQKLSSEAEMLKEEITSEHGMAIPVPKDLKKKPKFKVVLFN